MQETAKPVDVEKAAAEDPPAAECSLPVAAATLGISIRTARRWIHNGKLQAILRDDRYGPQYFVPGEHVAAVRASLQKQQAPHLLASNVEAQLAEVMRVRAEVELLLGQVDALHADMNQMIQQVERLLDTVERRRMTCRPLRYRPAISPKRRSAIH